MIMAYIVNVKKDEKDLGWYGKDQAYLYKDEKSAMNDAKKIQSDGYEAIVKSVAVFDVEQTSD